ncbi:hypothetical protein [Natronococcus occultus]|uniref:Uncharacterized protein n=1 Tax=Natronococcus occultus SP4 TaxID=694430 RepID=L0JUN2_9EURY|nr:hypothetical protein [Natronococcus occultus]AGB36471.1 hypothetical protein Natoc_0611 [Natronococcus occultus SP4]
MDRLDGVTLVGVLVLVASSALLEGAVVAAMLGGFLLSLSTWRLHGGRPWEALAWLAWVVTAVSVVLPLGSVAFAVVFFGSMLVGLGLLFGSRTDLLPDVWTMETAPGE